MIYGRFVLPPKYRLYTVEAGPAIECDSDMLADIQLYMLDIAQLLYLLQASLPWAFIAFITFFDAHVILKETKALLVSKLVVCWGFLAFFVLFTAGFVIVSAEALVPDSQVCSCFEKSWYTQMRLYPQLLVSLAFTLSQFLLKNILLHILLVSYHCSETVKGRLSFVKPSVISVLSLALMIYTAVMAYVAYDSGIRYLLVEHGLLDFW